MGWWNVDFDDEVVAVRLAKSKTDQRARGWRVQLARYPLGVFCPLWRGMVLRDKMAGVSRKVFCHADGSRVSAYQLLAVLRKTLRILGEVADSYGTDSFRIGAATEANDSGWGRGAIMELGTWSSECYRTYVRKEGGKEGN